MALETGTYISDLVVTNPAGTDPKSQGDDHLRLIKATIRTTFPNIAGAVTVTQTELNRLAGVTGVTGTGALVFGTAPAISNITLSGTVTLPNNSVADAALSSNVALKNGANAFTGANSFSQALRLATVELGHDTDTTLARIAAGRVSIEGGEIAKLNGTQPFSANQTFNGDLLLSKSSGLMRYTHNAGNDFALQAYPSGFRLFDYAAGGEALRRAPNGTLELYFSTTVELLTQDATTAPATTGAKVRHADAAYYDVGLNIMPLLIASSSITLARDHVGKTLMKNGGAITYTVPANSDTSIPDGSVINVLNNAAGNLTIGLGSGIGLNWATGAGALPTGARTLAHGGVATLWKADINNWYIWGTGIT